MNRWENEREGEGDKGVGGEVEMGQVEDRCWAIFIHQLFFDCALDEIS